MKAAILTAFDPNAFKGGIERYVLHTLELLQGQGIETDIYHTGIVENDFGFHDAFFGKIYALGRKFSEVDRDYDLIISNSFYGLGYFPPQCRAFNIFHSTHTAFAKAVEHVTSQVTFLELTHKFGYSGEMVSGYGRTNIAVSDRVREELEQHYGFDGVRVVESGIDSLLFRKIENREILREKYHIPRDAFVGIFVGRWDKTKGSDIIETVIEKTLDIHWLLVLGTGSESCSPGRMRNVTVLKEVPYEEMPSLYSSSDFMFFPSRYEGFGLVIIEAMACGLPVFTGEIGIAGKIHAHEPFSVLLLPDDSLISWAECVSLSVNKIYSLKADGALRNRLSAEGRRLVEENYGMVRWQRQMLKALELTNDN